MKYTGRKSVSDTNTTPSAFAKTLPLALSAIAVIAIVFLVIPARASAQAIPDTARKVPPISDTTVKAPVIPDTARKLPPIPDTTLKAPSIPGIRIRLGRDTTPFLLPSVQSRAERESYRQALAQIEAARATAFQQNMKTILEAVWGQVATTTFATSQPTPAYPGELPPKPKPNVPTKPVPIIGEYSDLGLQLDSRLEFRGERNQSKRCASGLFFDPVASCHSAFEPLVDFQFAARSGGIVADRVHVNLDYDTQREFDASNNISIYYEGKGNELLQRLEIGNVTFQPPASRFITTGIPSGNYGLQAITKIGPMRLRMIVAQQKGNVVRDRVFTVGDRTLRSLDRKIEDYQFEPRRFFFTVDPKTFGPAYPNIDILDTRRMSQLSASLPDSLRPTRLFVYRLLIGGQPPNPNGPQFRLIGDSRSRRGQVYEYLREGVDYYADPSLLWIALVRPLALNNERLVVAYRVRMAGRDTINVTTGGTPDLAYTPVRDQLANLIWDPNVKPGDPAFDREIRSVYRLGGSDVRRESVTLKVVTSSSADQEKPAAGTADTYLQLFGLAQRTNSSSFDVENRIWPRPADPNFELSLGSSGARTIRDQFLVFPSAKPFASTGLAGNGNPANDTIYTTPPEYVRSAQRPEAIYHIRVRYQAEGSGEGGTLMLGAVQIRPNSERLLVDGIPLSRGSDYSVDYDLGRVTFARPDTLFPRPRQVAVQYEENPLFEETPTSIFGATGEFQLANGQLAFTAISQNQKSNFTRPTLGFEPVSTLVAGATAIFSFDAPQLTSLASRLPYGETTAPSRIGVSAELAASKPRPGSRQQAYLESFEGEGGLFILLSDQQWYYSSQPALGRQLPTRFGSDVVDLNRAATLAWQSNGVDATGKAVRYSIEQIDTLTSLTGTGISGPETLLWMTLYPRSIGGLLDNSTGVFRWRLPSSPAGKRWRSIRTVLGSSGSDISRAENLEFWAQIVVSPAGRARNPVLVFDFGEISENSVSFSPDTLTLFRAPSRTSIDTSYAGRHLAGFDRLDSERDPFSRAFNVGANDTGLPGDVADSLFVVADTIPDVRYVSIVRNFRTCAGGFRILQVLGDSKVDCTIANNHLDEEDIDADNVLNLTSAERDAEKWNRYIVNLADAAKYTRIGKCSAPPTMQPARASSDSVCWVLFRVPFKTPDDSLGDPLLRRARALRLTMISGSGLGDEEFSTVPLARLRLTGAPWLKLGDHTLRGIAGDQPGSGFVQAGVIGTQDRNLTGGMSYESPPGVTDAPTSKTAALQTGRIQINERSLRLTANSLQPLERAEAYYRFPEGEKNFMSYTEVRVWARGIRDGWGPDGELQFYIRLGRDGNNFYMYRTPLNGGDGKSAWLPEIRVDFNKLFALRAEIQNAYLQARTRNTCKGLDSVLIANTPLPAGVDASARYAACGDGYIVYTIDPGSSPPNLAAVQEMAVGMVRTRAGASVKPILPSDTLELWVDDIRLGGAVNETGFAGQFGLAVTAADFADIRIGATRRDPHFRQLAESPTFVTDNSVSLSSAFHLEKLLPRALGVAIPFTVNYTSSSSDPVFVSQSDLEAGIVEGLRRPRSAATSVTFGIHRTRQSNGSAFGALIDNLSLSGAYTNGKSRSEYADGRAKNLVVGLDFNLSRALVPNLSRWTPAELHLASVYTNGFDNRTAYVKPAPAIDDPAKVVRGKTQTWRNGSSIVFHPFKSAAVRWDISSVRDLRNYGDQTTLGVVTNSERDRFFGASTGLERERAMQAGINIAPPINAWFRPRLDLGTTYNMLRDPNTLSFLRAQDSIGSYRLPRRLGNTQTMTAGFTLDIPRAVRGLDSGSVLRRWLNAFQPIDVNLNRSLLSAYEGTPMQPSLRYQLGFGGINAFRRLGGDLATSAGIVNQLSLNNSIRLPLGATLANRYQRINTRNWTRRFDERQEIVDGTQVVFPDISLRWSGQPPTLRRFISGLGMNARLLDTRQLNATEPLGGEESIDLGKIRVRSYPMNASLVFAGARPFSTSVGMNVSEHHDSRPGLASNGRTTDFSADVAKPWRLPADWHLQSDLRTRLSYQRSQGTNFVENPLAFTGRSRLADNARRAFSFNADTDVSDNLSSSFVISRVETLDRNLNRGFTQTVLSAVLHMQFYAGEFK